MKKAKPKGIIALSLLALFLLSSCAQEKAAGVSTKGEIDLSDFDTVLAMKRNIIYGYRFSEDGGCEFLSYDAAASNGMSHGSAKSFTISTDSAALIGDTLYLPVAAAGESGADEFQISLYRFDDRSSCDSKLLYTSKSPLVYSRAAGDILLLFHTTSEPERLITSIDAFDPESSQLKPFISKSCDMQSRDGSQILAFDYDAEHACVYVLLQENEASKRVLVNSYSLQNKEQLSSTDITNLSPDVTSQAISDFRSMGDYLYIRNFSDAACFSKLEKGRYRKLIDGDYEHPFVLAAQSGWNPGKSGNLLFFLRGSPVLFFYSTSNDTMEKIDGGKYGGIANGYRDDSRLLLAWKDGSDKISYKLISATIRLEGAGAPLHISADSPVSAKDLYGNL